MAFRVTESMIQIGRDLMEKKKVTESTATAYVKVLYMLNDKLAFKNLAFLKKTDDIVNKIASYADNTQKSIYTAVTSVLSMFKDKPTYKKVYNFYYEKMMGKAKDIRDNNNPSEKTEKQQEAWLSWAEVQNKKATMKAEILKFCDNKNVSPEQFSAILAYLVLCIYSDIPPRRNQDYLHMVVVKKWVDSMPTDTNYLDIMGSQFIFNKFKTAKTYGQQKVAIPNDLFSTIICYLRHHPIGKFKKSNNYQFLVNTDGSPVTAVNAITRILNKIFGKKIGSSMLRHIYITDKYGETKNQQEADAEAMGHSVAEQQGTYNVPLN